MRFVAAILLAAVLAVAGDDMSGEIKSGKPRKLVDEAVPLLEEGDGIYREWILEQLGEDVLIDRLKRAIVCYDEASAKLQAALDIEYDPGVNHRLRVSNRRLQKMRFRVHFQQPKPPGEKPPPPKPKPKPAPEADVLEEEEQRLPAPVVTFEESAPPARPVDAELPELAVPADAKIIKRDERAIRALLKEYYQSRKASNLLFRCRLCRGKGSQRDGSPCEDCGGAGERINLYHFRKAYWGVYTPVLRDAPGALAALRAFYERAQTDTAALAPLVKSFKVRQLDHKGYWARVSVEESTAEGRSVRTIALIGTGRSWYFYNPATDGELIPEGGK